MRKDILDRNYADFLVLPRQEPVQRDTFTEDEILRLRADADAGDETSMIILILIYTGYRINELLQSAGTKWTLIWMSCTAAKRQLPAAAEWW